jgi:hypothetical protein
MREVDRFDFATRPCILFTQVWGYRGDARFGGPAYHVLSFIASESAVRFRLNV